MDSDNGEMQYNYAIKSYMHTLCNSNPYRSRFLESTMATIAQSGPNASSLPATLPLTTEQYEKLVELEAVLHIKDFFVGK